MRLLILTPFLLLVACAPASSRSEKQEFPVEKKEVRPVDGFAKAKRSSHPLAGIDWSEIYPDPDSTAKIFPYEKDGKTVLGELDVKLTDNTVKKHVKCKILLGSSRKWENMESRIEQFINHPSRHIENVRFSRTASDMAVLILYTE